MPCGHGRSLLPFLARAQAEIKPILIGFEISAATLRARVSEASCTNPPSYAPQTTAFFVIPALAGMTPVRSARIISQQRRVVLATTENSAANVLLYDEGALDVE
jgi:hypothetical protein